ncbi:MAG: hypothetical protein WKG01_29630 [Kofleriaceae bacterium]
MRRTLPSVVGFGLACVLLLATAFARSEKTLAYPRDAVWPTTVRFLVVDESVKILEKDAEAGYVLFELRDSGKSYRGSLELLTIKTEGRTSVRFVITIPDRPSWMEIAMLQRLERKLRAELGSPNTAPAKPPGDGPKDPHAPKPPKDEPPKDPPARDPNEGGPPISPTP